MPPPPPPHVRPPETEEEEEEEEDRMEVEEEEEEEDGSGALRYYNERLLRAAFPHIGDQYGFLALVELCCVSFLGTGRPLNFYSWQPAAQFTQLQQKQLVERRAGDALQFQRRMGLFTKAVVESTIEALQAQQRHDAAQFIKLIADSRNYLSKRELDGQQQQQYVCEISGESTADSGGAIEFCVAKRRKARTATDETTTLTYLVVGAAWAPLLMAIDAFSNFGHYLNARCKKECAPFLKGGFAEEGKKDPTTVLEDMYALFDAVPPNAFQDAVVLVAPDKRSKKSWVSSQKCKKGTKVFIDMMSRIVSAATKLSHLVPAIVYLDDDDDGGNTNQ